MSISALTEHPVHRARHRADMAPRALAARRKAGMKYLVACLISPLVSTSVMAYSSPSTVVVQISAYPGKLTVTDKATEYGQNLWRICADMAACCYEPTRLEAVQAGIAQHLFRLSGHQSLQGHAVFDGVVDSRWGPGMSPDPPGRLTPWRCVPYGVFAPACGPENPPGASGEDSRDAMPQLDAPSESSPWGVLPGIAQRWAARDSAVPPLAMPPLAASEPAVAQAAQRGRRTSRRQAARLAPCRPWRGPLGRRPGEKTP
jgi:hypothetical protein